LKDGQRSSKHSNPDEENRDVFKRLGFELVDDLVAVMKRQHGFRAEAEKARKRQPQEEPVWAHLQGPSPHQDDRLLKIPIKNDRIFGYTGFCTKSGLGAVAAVYDRRLCRKLLDGRRYAKRKRDSAQP